MHQALGAGPPRSHAYRTHIRGSPTCRSAVLRRRDGVDITHYERWWIRA